MINTTFPPHKIPRQNFANRHCYCLLFLFIFTEAMDNSSSVNINVQIINFQHMITEEQLEDRVLRFAATQG